MTNFTVTPAVAVPAAVSVVPGQPPAAAAAPAATGAAAPAVPPIPIVAPAIPAVAAAPVAATTAAAPAPVAVAPGTPVVPSLPGVATPAPVAQAAPAVAVPTELPVGNMTTEQLDALSAVIDAQRAARPASVQDQIDALQTQLTGAHRGKEAAVETRKAAGAEANSLESDIATIKATLRRNELVEAATAARFDQPSAVALYLSNTPGDATALITQVAASGAFAMATPSTTAPIGAPTGVAPVNGQDAGIAAMIAEVSAATGR